MNDLARFVSFSLGYTQNYRIVDRNGDPWFVHKDVCKILGIKNPSDAVKNFPENEKSFTIEIYYSEDGRKRAHKILIINEKALYRLITRSSKRVARQLQDKIFGEILPAYRKQGINWASLPKIWNYRGHMLNYPEWRAKKEEAYFKRFPDADYEDFLNSLPDCPPVPPKQGEKREKSG